MIQRGQACRRFAGWAALAMIALAGCGGGGPTTYPVSGRVTYKGQPVTTGEIRYLPADKAQGHIARGAIDAQGAFELTTFKPGDGVLSGSYQVTISSYDPHVGEPGRDESAGTEDLATATKRRTPPPRKSRIPVRYARIKDSGLSDTVDDDHPGFREYQLVD